jgi:hypothetical protein
VAALTSPSVTSNPQILMDMAKIIQRLFAKEADLNKFQQQQQQHPQSGMYKNVMLL